MTEPLPAGWYARSPGRVAHYMEITPSMTCPDLCFLQALCTRDAGTSETHRLATTMHRHCRVCERALGRKDRI